MDHAPDPWQERPLRDAVLAGDGAVWERWFADAYHPLEGYVVWRCGGSRDLADEALQETWLTAVRRLRHFDPARASFHSWLCGIAANVLRNLLRGRQRRQIRIHSLSAAGADPAAQSDADEADRAEAVARALAALPEHYEAVLRAKYLDHHSVAAIAAARGASAKAVESLLTRARAAFREAYEQGEGIP